VLLRRSAPSDEQDLGGDEAPGRFRMVLEIQDGRSLTRQICAGVRAGRRSQAAMTEEFACYETRRRRNQLPHNPRRALDETGRDVAQIRSSAHSATVGHDAF
jgi:hypothetical protein